MRPLRAHHADHPSSSHPAVPVPTYSRYGDRIARHIAADSGYIDILAADAAVRAMERWRRGGGRVSYEAQAKAIAGLAERRVRVATTGLWDKLTAPRPAQTS